MQIEKLLDYPAVNFSVAKLGKGMFSSLEQAFVGRDERRAPLKRLRGRYSTYPMLGKTAEGNDCGPITATHFVPRFLLKCVALRETFVSTEH